MSHDKPRWAHVDALKAVACQLIVLHHLAFYGPMSDHVAAMAPALFEWLSRHARLAVQVFLVVGGYLAAVRLRPADALSPAQAGRLLRQRYLRLALPYAVMLLLAIGAAAVARGWTGHDSVPGAPTLVQVGAHLLLLQDLLGLDALSAGVWYVAIDFQLHALLVLLLAGCAWLERGGVRRGRLAPWLVALLVTASLFGFNRDPDWDVAAPYFFASYGLGVLAAWWSGPRLRAGRLALLAVLAMAALVVEFRSRIALALGVAALLALLQWRPQWVPDGPGTRLLSQLSACSYGVFLVHFPVCLLVNAAFDAFVPHEAAWQSVGLLLGWTASLAAGWVFHRQVERRAIAWLAPRRRATPSARAAYGLR